MTANVLADRGCPSITTAVVLLTGVGRVSPGSAGMPGTRRHLHLEMGTYNQGRFTSKL
ncbi:MAG TPA: hypothetical protein VM470_08435 [Acidimicrobiia bacterium]|nr:hypothetical protein [Acidimicrobiia bacterium]